MNLDPVDRATPIADNAVMIESTEHRSGTLKYAGIFALTVLSGCGTARLVDNREDSGNRDIRDITSIVQVLQGVHGPPESYGTLSTLLGPPIEHDFNGDGLEEILLVISDRGLGKVRVNGIDDLRKGIIVAGFLLFTKVEGKWWPVYYLYDHERVFLHLDRIYGPYAWDEKATRVWSEGLVVDADKEGRELTWFWHPAYPDWPYSFWATSVRYWDEGLEAYTGLRRGGFGPIHVVYGGK